MGMKIARRSVVAIDFDFDFDFDFCGICGICGICGSLRCLSDWPGPTTAAHLAEGIWNPTGIG